MMFTRVSLLLLVTGLFAGMWSADSPDGRTAAQIQLARRTSSPRSIGHGDVRHASKLVASVSLSGNATTAVPLPKGIAAGTYLVVDQAGSTYRLTVSVAEAEHSGNRVPVEQYTVRSGNSRWHFIRVEQPLERTMVHPIRQASAAIRR